ncbi:MAG TPA: GNAT family N-acetyltransferase [Bacillales bacterium]|nr:GNAT family N-acetyltransferase [Bacillales bacterium]
MKPNMIVKQLQSLDELKEMQELERAVWGMEPIPVHQTFTAAKNGGIILGAYVNGEMAGFSYSFPGFQDGQTYLCSHMLGVDPGYQNQGLGLLLKEKQREIALGKGYTLITWTFDPLLSLNAYLNLHKLRGVASQYTENLYGAMDDSLNQGLPTDRFTVSWWIDSEHVDTDQTELNGPPLDKNFILLDFAVGECGYPLAGSLSDRFPVKVQTGDAWYVPIPADFQKMKTSHPEWALDWRLKTRRIFQDLLDQGFNAVDLKRDIDGICGYYLFVRKEQLSIERSKSRE